MTREGYIKLPKGSVRVEPIKIDYNEIEDVIVDGVDFSDAPDFVDAYITKAIYKGREMTDIELDVLNDDRDYVYECVMYTIY